MPENLRECIRAQRYLVRHLIKLLLSYSYFIKIHKSVDDKFIIRHKKTREEFINDDFLKSKLINYEYELLCKNVPDNK